jgi:hypothetical protein
MKEDSYIDKPDVFWVSNTTGSILATELTFTTKKLPSTSHMAKMMSMPNISPPHLCTKVMIKAHISTRLCKAS